MAAKNFGTVHLYGIDAGTGAVASATVLGFSKNESHAVEEETANESGQVIELRLDDVRVDATIRLRIQSLYVETAVGLTLTYDSVVYIIVGKGRSEENRGFQELEYSLRTYEYTASA